MQVMETQCCGYIKGKAEYNVARGKPGLAAMEKPVKNFRGKETDLNFRFFTELKLLFSGG